MRYSYFDGERVFSGDRVFFPGISGFGKVLRTIDSNDNDAASLGIPSGGLELEGDNGTAFYLSEPEAEEDLELVAHADLKELAIRELSSVVTKDIARKIAEGAVTDRKVLGELSDTEINEAAIAVLMLCPNFPMEKRENLIRNGRADRYLDEVLDCLNPRMIDEDAVSLASMERVNSRLLRRIIECKGLRDDTYRFVYDRWIRQASPSDLVGTWFLLVSAYLPEDIKLDFRGRCRPETLPQIVFNIAEGDCGYIRVVDRWNGDAEFLVDCRCARMYGSLFEFVSKAEHFATENDYRCCHKDGKLFQEKCFGGCKRYDIW